MYSYHTLLRYSRCYISYLPKSPLTLFISEFEICKSVQIRISHLELLSWMFLYTWITCKTIDLLYLPPNILSLQYSYPIPHEQYSQVFSFKLKSQCLNFYQGLLSKCGKQDLYLVQHQRYSFVYYSWNTNFWNFKNEFKKVKGSCISLYIQYKFIYFDIMW